MTTLLTPYDRGTASPAGRNLFRKQLLPIRRIDYKGRVIDFTRDYLAGLVKAFHDGAYDFVPFQMAPHGNEHTNDPERCRGEIAALELTDDGLDVIVAASDEGAKVLRANPKLGVSARIVESYQRSDGKHFPAAIQHVLGTLDPRIPGMRPWQAVEAANDGDGGEVIDLTAPEFAAPAKPAETVPDPAPAATGTPPAKEDHMPFTPEQEARLAKLLDLPEDRFNTLLAEPDETAGEELSDEELAELLAEIPEETGEPEGEEPDGAEETEPADEPELVSAGASLTAEAQAQIDLANARAEETSLELARVTQALNRTAYEAERKTFAETYGIPPRIFDLARPVLEGDGHTVDLANGKAADAGAIVRSVLKEFGRTVKALDLSVETGTALDGSAEAERASEEQATAERAAVSAAFRRQAGL